MTIYLEKDVCVFLASRSTKEEGGRAVSSSATKPKDSNIAHQILSADLVFINVEYRHESVHKCWKPNYSIYGHFCQSCVCHLSCGICFTHRSLVCIVTHLALYISVKDFDIFL